MKVTKLFLVLSLSFYNLNSWTKEVSLEFTTKFEATDTKFSEKSLELSNDDLDISEEESAA